MNEQDNILDTRTNLQRGPVTTREKLVTLQLSKTDGSIPINYRVYFARDFELNNAVIKGISAETRFTTFNVTTNALIYGFKPNAGFAGTFTPIAYFTLTLRDNYDNILIEHMPLSCLSKFASNTASLTKQFSTRRFHIDKNALYGRMCLEKSYITYTGSTAIVNPFTIYYAGINFIYNTVKTK